MKDKFVVITGANAGIGKETTRGLAKAGARVAMLCRSVSRGEAAKEEILQELPDARLEVHACDLSSLSAVRQAAARIRDTEEKVDVLINNAGLFTSDYQETEEGFELQFGVNHLAHFLLTLLLFEPLRAAPQGRVISVSSTAHYLGKIDFDDLHHRNDYSGLRAYGQSKVANVLFTLELHRRLQAAESTSVTANCLHPGAVGTNFGAQHANNFFIRGFWKLIQPFLISPRKGAQTSLYLATSPLLDDTSGKYFDDCKPKAPSAYARQKEPAHRLWELSRELTGAEAGL